MLSDLATIKLKDEQEDGFDGLIYLKCLMGLMAWIARSWTTDIGIDELHLSLIWTGVHMWHWVYNTVQQIFGNLSKFGLWTFLQIVKSIVMQIFFVVIFHR